VKPHVLLVFMTRFEGCTAMLRGIAKYEHSHRPWTVFLDDEGLTAVDPGWLREGKWGGVISHQTTVDLAQACEKLNIPLVDLSDKPPFPGVPKVRPDNTVIGHIGAEHFLERGHTHFGFCGFANASWSCERRAGFGEALRLTGHGCSELDVEWTGGLTPEWDARQTSVIGAWLRRLPKPVAVMACDDMRALQVIAAAQAMDLLVPEEVAILGVNNDTARCDLARPPLSSVAPNAFQAGYQAAEILDQRMAGRKIEDCDIRIEPVEVITRHSTDIVAVADKNVAAALTFIRENACSGITVEQVLHHAFTSRSVLEKKLRRYLGRSPQAEIRRVQVAKVRQLLLETDFPLKKIAELTGFEHVEYMYVVFKRLIGDSPGSFRRKNKSGVAR
jgi:LacI family transcriptional regulator